VAKPEGKTCWTFVGLGKKKFERESEWGGKGLKTILLVNLWHKEAWKRNGARVADESSDVHELRGP